jgi:hypothetical protein
MVRRSIGNSVIQAGGKSFPEKYSPKEMAYCEAALDELLNRGFISRRSDSHYLVTKDGFDFLETVAAPTGAELA